jgi:hypothetical protein
MPLSGILGIALLALAAMVPAQLAIDRMAAPPHQAADSPFAAVRNHELRKQALRMAAKLRDHAAKARVRELHSLRIESGKPFEPLDLLAEYDRRFKPRALQLRDEMLSRLPLAKRPDLPDGTLEFASTAAMIDEAAELLETLARMLPEMWYREEAPKLLPPPVPSPNLVS